MRITSTNRWEFDLPSGTVLTVTEQEAAVWLDRLIRENAEIERLRAELAACKEKIGVLIANIETMRQAALIDDWHTFDAAIDAARRET
jgi:hypothetical protein